ncbi:MAG: glycine--tRNA ligase subunit alpha [Veillonella atypica]
MGEVPNEPAATFLHAIGPEPRAVFVLNVEPFSSSSRRSLCSDNPNRLFQHHQFQVIVENSSPDNIQELYLQSLGNTWYSR